MEAIETVNGVETGRESDEIVVQVTTGANEALLRTRKDKVPHDASEQEEQGTTKLTIRVRRDLCQVLTERTRDVATEDIEYWTLCETPTNAQESSKQGRAEKARSTAQRTLRSDTMKQQHGKSTFGGKMMIFNIHTEKDQPQRAQRARKWQVPTKLNGIRNSTKTVDSASEMADKRRKRNLNDDNVDIEGFLIPNLRSLSAGTADMMIKPVTPKETWQGIDRQSRDT